VGRLGVIALCVALAVMAPATTAVADPGVAKDARHCPAGLPGGFKTKRVVGLTLGKAKRRADANGCSVRVVKRDGENLSVTADYVQNRINVAVADERVKRVLAVG
jgi:hypothetical protein